MDKSPPELIDYICTKLSIRDIYVLSITSTLHQRCKVHLKNRCLIECRLSKLCDPDRVLQTISYLAAIDMDMNCNINVRRKIKLPIDQRTIDATKYPDMNIILEGDIFVQHKKYTNCLMILDGNGITYQYAVKGTANFPQFVLECNRMLNIPNDFDEEMMAITFLFTKDFNPAEGTIFGKNNMVECTFKSIQGRYSIEDTKITVGGCMVTNLADIVDLYEELSQSGTSIFTVDA
jgi:hypothetical protein